MWAGPVVTMRTDSAELTVQDGRTGLLAKDLDEFRAQLASLTADRAALRAHGPGGARLRRRVPHDRGPSRPDRSAPQRETDAAMIDLSLTRAAMLKKIEAPPLNGNPLTDPTDPRLLVSNAHLVFRGHTRNDLFPLVEVVISERFARAPLAGADPGAVGAAQERSGQRA